MPKNLTGGKRHKGKKNKPVTIQDDSKIEYAGDQQFYACIKKKVGGQRLIVMCSDDKERSAVIPGKFFKRVWMNPGDIVLCNADENGREDCCYIVYKYNNREASTLKSQGKINFEVQQEKEDQTYQLPEESDEHEDPFINSDSEIEVGPKNKKNTNTVLESRKLEFPESDDDSDDEINSSSSSLDLDDL